MSSHALHAQNTTSTQAFQEEMAYAGPDDMLRAKPMSQENALWGITCRLDQVMGILKMVTGNVDDSGSFAMSDHIIVSALWGAESLVSDAQKLLVQAEKKQPYKASPAAKPQSDTVPARADTEEQPSLLAAAQRLQALIRSGDVCIKFEAPSNAPDARRDVLADFAAALAAAEGAP